MASSSVGGSAVRGAAPALPSVSRASLLRAGLALVILSGIAVGAHALHDTPGQGARASFSLLTGAALGLVFAGGRFCFFCILRDFFEDGSSRGVFAILAALAVGSVGYAVVFGAFLPNPMSGRLPPDAHIGPVSWVLVAAGAAFGVGMALSGACISGHLYRLGEGSVRAPFALLGTLVGFGAGFFTWQSVYLSAIAQAPVAWLPAALGYGGALALTLAVLAAVGLLLLRYLPAADAARPAGDRLTPAAVYRLVVFQRWNPLVTGALVGVIGTFAYFRVEPLGVTAQLGSLSRTILDSAGLLAGRLNGLDGFAGCATVVAQTITENGWLIGGLALGSLSLSLLAGRFQPERPTVRGSLTALGGGVLMGWGAMLALGCTVGTLLSGVSAFAVSGWVFGGAVLAGVWFGIRLGLHRW